jgi:hypothetical protein
MSSSSAYTATHSALTSTCASSSQRVQSPCTVRSKRYVGRTSISRLLSTTGVTLEESSAQGGETVVAEMDLIVACAEPHAEYGKNHDLQTPGRHRPEGGEDTARRPGCRVADLMRRPAVERQQSQSEPRARRHGVGRQVEPEGALEGLRIRRTGDLERVVEERPVDLEHGADGLRHEPRRGIDQGVNDDLLARDDGHARRAPGRVDGHLERLRGDETPDDQALDESLGGRLRRRCGGRLRRRGRPRPGGGRRGARGVRVSCLPRPSRLPRRNRAAGRRRACPDRSRDLRRAGRLRRPTGPVRREQGEAARGGSCHHDFGRRGAPVKPRAWPTRPRVRARVQGARAVRSRPPGRHASPR